MRVMKIKTVYILYIIAALAFLFALLKYFFLSVSIPTNFFILELFSFIGFIGIVYFTDRLIRNHKKEIENKELFFKQKEEEYLQQINQNLKTIDKLNKDYNKDTISQDEIHIISKDLSQVVAKNSDLKIMATSLLNRIAHYYEIGLGVCYFKTKLSAKFSVQGVYGLKEEEILEEIDEQSGINGECIRSKKSMLISDIDEEYFSIESCSGSSKPKHLYLLPIVINDKTIGLIEIATFKLINIENHWLKISNGISELKDL